MASFEKSRGEPRRTERLPLSFDAITPAWLTELLRHQYPGTVISDMHLLSEIKGHTSKARYAIDRNQAALDAGLPDQICLKANLTGDPLSSNACVNEARFYGLFSGTLDLPAPRCFLADWDDDAEGQQGLVILEDLVPLGGEFGTSGQSLTHDAMASALTEMARLHGMTWALPDLDRQRWLLTGTTPATAGDDYWTLMRDYVARHNEKPEHLAVLPAWASADPQRLHKAYRQLCEREAGDHSPLCLVHGDAHIGNSYLRPDGARMWFDWQIVRKARPWRDVAYFMVGSLGIDQRRASERALIRHYCDEMSGHGVRLDFDTAWDDYRRWILWGLIAWHLNINPNEDTVASLDRFGTAAKDLDTGSFYGF
ncbi:MULTISPECIES: phosphotransferase [Sphingobium]|uniref:CHK kinase-like domain-containing protein n=1 Tax=Sphingobium baderi TaxID=1332080 RepID=A0A0S3EYM7_9SPHN|nr:MULTISPECIES: phosphotransferase [Sphingobium]ALR20552.1 hypothetical protein ATN00_09785 [Sphingobium baderi]